MTNSRSKGRRGESAAKRLLAERDWTILADTTAGVSSCDLVASKGGVVFSVEVKNREIIHPCDFRSQAMRNATKGTRWMWMAKVAGTRSWLVERQGERPCVWTEVGK